MTLIPPVRPAGSVQNGSFRSRTDTRIHGADEFAVVDELLVSAKIFAQAIVELCS